MSSVSLSVSLAQHIRMHLSAYADLPPAGESWTTAETDLDGGDINKFRALDVIEQVGRDGGHRIWETRESVWERVQSQRESLGLLPCGHRPFSTVDLDAERPYGCLGEDCEARYTRAEIEAVIDDA